tara:strand:- start:36 stop:587 length:552 start_codon:yes stop_codon:yes gene_type:complete
MSENLIKKYDLDEDDFWTLRGNKIISFDGVIKIIEAENIKFEMSDNLDVSPSVAIKVKAYQENDEFGLIEEVTFGEANDTNCKNQYFWAMAEKRGKARATLKLLGLYGKNAFYSDVEAEDFQMKSPTIKQVEEFNRLEKEALEKGVLGKDARNWLSNNSNGIRSNVNVYEKALASLKNALEGK